LFEQVGASGRPGARDQPVAGLRSQLPADDADQPARRSTICLRSISFSPPQIPCDS
jgi:hypothetical protein